MQYLYHQDDEFIFMDQRSYEQTSLRTDLLGDATRYLKDNTVVTVVYFEDRPIAVELPHSVALVVVETAPGIRGDTASGGSKPARVETGAVVQVPLFVQEGDTIRVDTRSGEYLERAF
jgi:elongation factor P